MRVILLPLLLLLLAPTAQAASLVYLGADGNVRVSSADGTLQRQVTTDAVPGAPYSAPTADDAGVILAFGHPDAFTARLLRQDGSDAHGPFALPASSCSAGPRRSAISPDGTRLAAAWVDGRAGCATPGVRRHHPGPWPALTTSVLFGDAPTALVGEPGAPLPSFDGHRSPRWITAPAPRLAAIAYDAIDVQASDAADAPMARWAGVPRYGARLDSFDVSRAGDLLLLETSAAGWSRDGEGRRLEVLRVTGVPPRAATARVCVAAHLADAGARPALPRWSPDGTQVAWAGAAGVYVSPAPVTGADGRCVLAPRLVAPGGRDAAWTPADVTPVAAPQPDEAPARTGAPPSTVRRLSGAPSVNPAARIVLHVTLKSARTIRVRIERLPAAGRAGRARLVGVVAYRGHAGRNPLYIAKVGGRPLPDGRYRVTITAFRHQPRVLVVTLDR